MDTRKNNNDLTGYGRFIKNNNSNNSDSDVELESLQAEEDFLPYGVFVKPPKRGLLRHAEKLRQDNELENLPLEEELPKNESPQIVEEKEPIPQVEFEVKAQPEPAPAPEPVPEPAPVPEPVPEPEPEVHIEAAPVQINTSPVHTESTQTSQSPGAKVKRPIGVKLILIISLLVIFAMGVITVLVSYFISKDTRINAEDNNLTINS